MLSDEKNWFDLASNQNDPFELKMGYIDKSELLAEENDEMAYRCCQMILEQLRASFGICCFTENSPDCLPMWAYYTNNYKGFCIRYRTIKKNVIFRTQYDGKRYKINHIVLSLIAEMKKSSKVEKSTDLLDAYRYLVFNLMCCKHNSWAHEREFRIFFPTDEPKGFEIENSILGVVPECLYIGNKCSTHNKYELIGISKEILHCKVYQVDVGEKDFLNFKEL